MPHGCNRRRFLQWGRAAAAAVALGHVRTSRAAGTLSIGAWDHWVPGYNDMFTKVCKAWGEQEKVDVQIDYITLLGNKLRLTVIAEAQSRSGHDLLPQGAWTLLTHAAQLEPVDDVVVPATQQYGRVSKALEYFCRHDGRWIGTPNTLGMRPACARLDLFRQHAGIDLQAMYPPNAPPTPEADHWTWDTLLVAAEKLHKAGHPVGLGLGTTYDSVDWVGALFGSLGADLVDAKGAITVKTDAVRHALEYARRLVQVLPPDVFAWDEASNNKYLISGQGSLIANPPSPWVTAKRDNPKVAEQLWHLPLPKGPKGRYVPLLPSTWGLWNFSKNKPAAKALLRHLLRRETFETMVNASLGFDIPAFESMRDFHVWQDAGPPKGTLYHYPPRDDQILWAACAPAPPDIARQMYTQAIMTKMIARCSVHGEPIEKTLDWAAAELEGYKRS